MTEATKVKLRKCLFGAFLLSPLLLGLVLAVPEVQAAEKVLVPKLEVPIPGFDLNNYAVTRSGSKFMLPWIGAYFAGLYRYAISVSLVAAAVMIVYGGFKYILGSSMGAIQSGKETINNALVGLVLVLCIYVILSAINPATLQPKAMEVEAARKDPQALAFLESIATRNATAPTAATSDRDAPSPPPMAPSIAPSLPPAQSAPASQPPSQPSGSQPAPQGAGGGQQPGGGGDGGGAPVSGDCPIQPDLVPDPRKVMLNNASLMPFYQAVMSKINGRTFPQRVKQVADIVISCKANLGSCGQTMQRIWAMAGVMDNTFLQDKKNETGYGTAIFKMKLEKVPKGPPQVQKDLTGLSCAIPESNKCRKSDCLQKKDAVARARQLAEEKGGPNYPDDVVNQLQPGDWIYFYTGNADCAGNHSIIFMGWADSKGTARMITGQVQRDQKGPLEAVHYQNYCLKKSCGAYYPIVQLNRPSPEILNFGDIKPEPEQVIP